MSQHRSFSQVGSLRSCGEQYRLKRIVGIAERPSCAAMAGKIIHAATEAIDEVVHDWQSPRNNPTQTSEQHPVGLTDGVLVQAATAAARESMEYELNLSVEESPEFADPKTWKAYGRQDWDWFMNVGIPKCITSYIEWRLSRLDLRLAIIDGFGPAVEIPVEPTLAEGTAPIRGYVDRVFEHTVSGVKYVVDLKSGKKPKSTEQLGVYRRGLKDLGVDVDYGFYVYGMKIGPSQTAPADLTVWTDERLGRIYSKADSLIEQGLYLPNPGEACFTCGVTAACDYYETSLV